MSDEIIQHWTTTEYRPISDDALIECTIVYSGTGSRIRSMEFPSKTVPEAVLALARQMNEHALRNEGTAA